MWKHQDIILIVLAAQHYLVHLLRHKIEESHSRLVVVTSGIVRGERDTSKPLIPRFS